MFRAREGVSLFNCGGVIRRTLRLRGFLPTTIIQGIVRQYLVLLLLM